MIDQIRASLARNLPRLDAASVTLLGDGADNVAYEVNEELVLRARKPPWEPDDMTVEQEAALLEQVRPYSILPIPEVVFVDGDARLLAYRKLPGLPLSGEVHTDPTGLGKALGRFVARLHEVPAASVEALVPAEDEPMSERLRAAQRTYLAIAELLPPSHRRLVEAFLAQAPPPNPDVVSLCHNDLGAEHILVDPSGEITGIIDWTDAALADPVLDLALIFRDLGPKVFDQAAAGHDPPLDASARARVGFYARCGLLEDVAFGMETGRQRYIEAGLAHLVHTFAPI